MNQLGKSLANAFKYLEQEGVEIPPDIWCKSLRADAFKAGSGELTAINKAYHDAITKALVGYFEGGNATSFKNEFKRGTLTAFNDAYDLGWVHGGGTLPLPADALDWLEARMQQEFGFIDMLFAEAKQLRREEGFDFFAWATDRADGYTATVREVYNNAKVRAMPNRMVEFTGDDGAESCDTCQKLKGKKHKLSWFIAHNYIPPYGGGLLCARGGRCMHFLKDVATGEELTLKHYGPGEHPGTGTPQEVHAGEQLAKVTEKRDQLAMRMETIRNEMATAPTRFADVQDQDLLDRRDRFYKQMEMAKKDGRDDDYQKWKDKLEEAKKEIARRRELRQLERQYEQVLESLDTGKLTVTEGEMRDLLANAGDTYREAGYHGEYNPDLFIVSDLSGARVRHYVRLPDGRIAHPDELIEARQRGRIIVVQDVRQLETR